MESNDQNGIKETEQAWFVEDILSKRKMNGREEYYVAWQGFPEDENSWEPKSSLAMCQDLKRAFDVRWAKKFGENEFNSEYDFRSWPKRTKAERQNYKMKEWETYFEKPTKLCKLVESLMDETSSTATTTSNRKIVRPKFDAPTMVTGFDRGLTVDRILAMQNIGEHKLCMVQWRETYQREMLPLSLIRQKQPLVYLRFLEAYTHGMPTCRGGDLCDEQMLDEHRSP